MVNYMLMDIFEKWRLSLSNLFDEINSYSKTTEEISLKIEKMEGIRELQFKQLNITKEGIEKLIKKKLKIKDTVDDLNEKKDNLKTFIEDSEIIDIIFVTEERHGVSNGLVGLNRDILMKLIKMMKNEAKTRTIIGMMETFYTWSRLPIFHWAFCKPRPKTKEQILLEKKYENNYNVQVLFNNLSSIKSALVSTDTSLVLETAKIIRKLVSTVTDPPVDVIIEMRILPLVVNLLKLGNPPEIHLEACWILTNITAMTHTETAHVVRAGAVPLLVALVSSPDSKVAEQAVWGLGNIAADSRECQETVKKAGFLEKLLPLLHTKKSPPNLTDLIRSCAQAVSSLSMGYSEWDPSLTQVFPFLAHCVRSLHIPDILTYVLCALKDITQFAGNITPAVVQPGILLHIVAHVSHANPDVQKHALLVLGNVVAGTEGETAVAMHAGALPVLVRLLRTPLKEKLRIEICWIVANLASVTAFQHAVMQSGVVKLMLHLLTTLRNDKVNREILYTFINLTIDETPPSAQIEQLVQMGMLETLIQFLRTQNDAQCVLTLKVINAILLNGRTDGPDNIGVYEERVYDCDGVGVIEGMQTIRYEDAAKMAREIISKFFSILK